MAIGSGGRAVVTTSVLASTLDNYSGTLTDAIYKGIPTIRLLLTSGKVDRISGGDTITDNILYAENGTLEWLSSGSATIDVTPQEESRNLSYNWSLLAGAVSIPKIEIRNNSGNEARIFSLLESKLKSIELSAKAKMNRDLFAASAAAKDISSLVDLVGTTNTVGGVAGSVGTYWQSTLTASGSFAGQGVSDMRTNFLTVSQGNDTPDVLIADKTTYGYYENSQQAIQRYVDTTRFDAGAEALAFKNAAMIPDADATSGVIYLLNLSYFRLVVHKDAEFKFSPAIEPANQDVETYKYLWQGQLVTNNRRMQGKLTSITA